MTLSYLDKKYRASSGAKNWLFSSQEPASGPSTEPDESNPKY